MKSALRNFARASMDLSDGLAKDLGRMCRASGYGAEIDVASIPRSATMARLLATDGSLVTRLVAAGDDYEILAAVAPENEADFVAAAGAGGVPVTRIGEMCTEHRVSFRQADGRELQLETTGYDHFARS